MQEEHLQDEVKLCTEGAYFLRLICSTAYFATVGESIYSSVDLFDWISCIPQFNTKDTEILNDLNSGFAFRYSIEKYDEGEKYVKRLVHGGVTNIIRILLYTVALMKISIELGLLIIGNAYILYARTNEDLILNSLSLVFVAEFDNIAYAYSLTDAMKWMTVQSMPVFGYLRDAEDFSIRMTNRQLFWQVFGPWLKVILFVTVPSCIWFIWC